MTAAGTTGGGFTAVPADGVLVGVGRVGGAVLAGVAAAPAAGGVATAAALAGVGGGSDFDFSSPTACLTRSTKAGSGSTTGGGGGGGGGGSTTFSPDHSRKLWQDVQNDSPSGFWLPHFLQTITARLEPGEMLSGDRGLDEEVLYRMLRPPVLIRLPRYGSDGQPRV